jgi:hypothetical protein
MIKLVLGYLGGRSSTDVTHYEGKEIGIRKQAIVDLKEFEKKKRL